MSGMRQHPVLIVCGATGSGKSTQLPKLALRAGRRSIAHTQPRRLAARTLAERIASEMQIPVGAEVGWQVRFAQAVSEQTCVKLMTDGILLSELRHDPTLARYDTIILDEAHERSLNIDFLLGCLHRLLRTRSDLRLIITSATLDAEKFSRHFNNAPVFSVEGRSFPVDIRYRPPPGGDLTTGIAEGLRELWKTAPGDVLVFLPGEREIRDLRDALPRRPELARYGDAEFLPLYARLPAAQQQRIFNPAREGRRVILATNVAETSLTVPGIRFVIDSGLARIARFSPRSQLQSLAIEPVAQDALLQRAGRCGRLAPGICLRLFDETDFASRPPETPPEILRSNLADVVLQMADRRLGDAEDFPFVDVPDSRLLRDARRLLQQLQALREDGRTTPTGRRMARLPVEPRFARMLLEAERMHCLDATVVVVSALSMPDVRDVAPEDRAAARQCHAPWRDSQSDFATLLAMYRAIAEQRTERSRGAFERWCKEHYLNPRRVREWQDLVHQIHRELRAAGFARPRETDADPAAALHRALLVGLLDHIGQHHENGEFRGPRGTRWFIHPESALKKCRSGWVFAASIVSTQRTFARTVARVDPAALLAAAGPLVRRSPLDPRWDPARGEVMCTEQCRLFGMVIESQRQVPLARHDPPLARQLFIDHALVQGRWGASPPPAFLQRNRQLIATISREEERLRRRDLLLDDEGHAALYDAHLPGDVSNRQQLLSWLATQPTDTLCWSREQLTAGPMPSLLDSWPTQISVRGQQLPLKYRFAPGDADDGVTVLLPLEALSQLQQADFDGRVPGLAEQQLEALLRNLPKADRRKLIPLAESLRGLQADVEPGPQFLTRFRDRLEARLAHTVPADLLDLTALPDRLKLRFAAREGKRIVDADRDLSALRRRLAAPAKAAAHDAVELPHAMTQPLTRFPDPAPAWAQRSPRGTPMRLILRDHGEAVRLEVCAQPDEADDWHAAGLRRLAWLRLKPRISLRLKALKSLRHVRISASSAPAPWPALQRTLGAGIEDASSPRLGEALALHAIAQMGNLTDAGQSAFEAQVDAHWPQIDRVLEQAQLALQSMDPLWGQLRLQLAAEPDDSPLRLAAALLLPPGFASLVDDWPAMPRYLQALSVRIDKRKRNPGLDHDREQQLQGFERRLQEAAARHPSPSRRPTLRRIYWALQDFRVQQFAQDVGSPHPVSEKRLNQLFLELTRDPG